MGGSSWFKKILAGLATSIAITSAMDTKAQDAIEPQRPNYIPIVSAEPVIPENPYNETNCNEIDSILPENPYCPVDQENNESTQLNLEFHPTNNRYLLRPLRTPNLDIERRFDFDVFRFGELNIAHRSSLELSLEDGFELDLFDKRVTDPTGNFTWTYPDVDICHNGWCHVIYFFENLFNLDSNYGHLTILNGTSLQSFIDTYQDIVMGSAFQTRDDFLQLTDVINNSYEDFFEENGDDFERLLSDLLNDYEDSQEINEESLSTIEQRVREFFSEYEEIDSEEIDQITESVNSFIENLITESETYSNDEYLRELLLDPLNNITYGGLSLIEINNLFGDITDFLGFRISSNSIDANVEISSRLEFRNNLYLSQELISNGRSIFFEHGASLDANAGVRAYFNFNAGFVPGAMLSDFLQEISVIQENSPIDTNQIMRILGQDIQLFDLYLNSSAGYSIWYSYDYSDTYQVLAPHLFGLSGFGFRRQRFFHYFDFADAYLNSEISTTNITSSFNARMNHETNQYEGFRNMAYIFTRQRLDPLWGSLTLGLTQEESLISRERLSYSTSAFASLDRQYDFNFNEDYSESSYQRHFLMPNYSIAMGVDIGPIRPFFSLNNYNAMNSSSVGLVFNFFNFIAKTEFQNGQPTLESFIILHDPENEIDYSRFDSNRFTDFFREVELNEQSPLDGGLAQREILMRNLYSEFDGVLLRSSLDIEGFDSGLIYCTNSSFFIEVGINGNYDGSLLGGHLVLGNSFISGRAMLSYGFNDFRNTHNYAAEIGVSGSVGELNIEFILQGVSNEGLNIELYNYPSGEHRGFLRLSMDF